MNGGARWYGAAFTVFVMAPFLVTFFVLISVVGALIPNMIVGLPLAICGVTGWWFWVPTIVWALPGIALAWLFFWEEVLGK